MFETIFFLSEGRVPATRAPVGVYTVPGGVGCRRAAIFPHGSGTKPGLPVISDRAIKHLHCLTSLQGSTLRGKRVQSAVVFLVNRGDCAMCRPCHEADPLFAQMLQRAQRAGVVVVAQEVVWRDGGRGEVGRLLPVEFHDSVDADAIDEAVLQRVLTYNSEHGSDRSYKGAGSKKRKRE